MKKKVLRLTVAGALVACTFGTGAARADTVTEWNAIMTATVTAAGAVPPTNPHYQSRWGAIVQLAVFEAVNAIVGDYEPYLGVVEAPAWASPDAAVIAAAHRTLVNLRPDRAAALDILRANSLAAILDGPAKEAGILAGEDAAAAMLLLRADDGSVEAADTPYTPGTDPGDYQPLPGQTPLLPGWSQVTPFGLLDVTEFRLPPPPALDSGRYADDYNDVKLLGSLNSPFRPQDRTDVARFYAATSPTVLWNSAARQASAAQGKSLSENAQIFAVLAMAMGDASIAMWDTKYHYNFWRPQAAIRAGHLDGNDKTDADPDWLPLITTPAHPSYASGHASGSGAARRVLEHVFGKNGHDITLTNPGLPGIVLDYTAWDEITDDIDDARVYGGIHFWFDQEAGARLGRHVGSYILENYLHSVD